MNELATQSSEQPAMKPPRKVEGGLCIGGSVNRDEAGADAWARLEVALTPGELTSTTGPRASARPMPRAGGRRPLGASFRTVAPGGEDLVFAIASHPYSFFPTREASRRRGVFISTTNDEQTTMGLDVYLKRSEQKAADFVRDYRKAKGDERERLSEGLLDAIVPESKVNPKQLFRVDYWRSSYNEGGINSRMRDAIGEDLYTLAGSEERDDYYRVPDWRAMKERTEAAIAKWRQRDADLCGFTTWRILMLPGHELDAKRAIDSFLAAKKRDDAKRDKRDEFNTGDFSSKDGTFFFGSTPKVYGVMPGPRGSVLLVVEGKTHESYFEALQVVIETCNFVLAQDDRDHYLQEWSG